MFLVSALLFFVAEVVAFIEVGEHIGFGWAALILIGMSALGPFMIRRAGSGVLGRTQDRLAQGELPTRELLDGVVVLLGGVMVCVPGFISDAIGLLLMVGPVRRLLIRAGGRHLARRVQAMRPGHWTVINVRARQLPGNTPSPPPSLPREIESGNAATADTKSQPPPP